MRQQRIEHYILNELAGLLDCQLDQQAVDKSFHELGMDSLVGMRLVGKLADSVGEDIDPLIVFDYPSIRELSLYLYQEFGGLASTEPELSY